MHVLMYLVNTFPPWLFDTPGFVSLAMDTNNKELLEKLNHSKTTDMRKHISERDLAVAVHKGNMDVLNWVHEICPCVAFPYSVCMFDSDLYSISVRARRSDVATWLRENTNCFSYRYHNSRLGHHWYGHGHDFGGAFWFR